MSKLLRAIQFDGTTFGMEISAEGTYRKFKNRVKPEKAIGISGKEFEILAVAAEWLGAIMGEAHWLVTECRYFDKFKIDESEDIYVKYDDEQIDFRTRRHKYHISN